MEYQVRLEQVPAQPTAVIRCQARQSDLSKVVPQACGEVWNFFRSAGLPRPGRHVALYLDCVMNLEIGVEVDFSFTDNERVVASSTPAGTVATTTHFGSYGKLGEAHQAVHAWCQQNGHALAGPSWEIYGHWDEDPAKVRTDVYWLLTAECGT